MSIDQDRLVIEQVTRVLSSMGWEVVTIDLQEDPIRLIIQRPKTRPASPG